MDLGIYAGSILDGFRHIRIVWILQIFSGVETAATRLSYTLNLNLA